MSKLALFVGKKSVRNNPKNTLTWPIITKEIENAVLKILRAGNMSGYDVTKKFEQETVQARSVSIPEEKI